MHKMNIFILLNYFKIILLLSAVDDSVGIAAMDKSLNIGSSDPSNDLVQLLTSKSYVPNEVYMSKTSVVKNADPDTNFLLSKLSDQDLLRLLNEQPKKYVYDLSDAIKLASNSKIALDAYDTKAKKLSSFSTNSFGNKNINTQTYQEIVSKNKPDIPVFRLEYKPVKPFNFKEDVDFKHKAVQKLNNMLYSRPQELFLGNDEAADKKKELLFDILVAQLKSLCCKRNKPENNVDSIKHKLKSALNEIIGQNTQDNWHSISSTTLNADNEHIFLILNDEIKTNPKEDLIPVDPDTLDRNSSVLLLGPITSHLSDSQLKLVMNRISNELSRPEYLPVLQQLSDGTIDDKNLKLVKSLITGPEIRRYIKPHRCNHQSKLARIYGGPKWIICTGYLNLNTPSIYDK